MLTQVYLNYSLGPRGMSVVRAQRWEALCLRGASERAPDLDLAEAPKIRTSGGRPATTPTQQYTLTVDSKTLEHGCRVELEDGHAPAFWLLMLETSLKSMV